MVDLLLITDIPRLIRIFSQLSEAPGVSMRVATSLDGGATEIAGDKPAIIFVQTHLSGFSADILLMHLKKQLGRRRSRFVLLCDPEQISDEILNLYHAHIDTSLEDSRLLTAVMDQISDLRHRAKSEADAAEHQREAAASLQQKQATDDPTINAAPQIPVSPDSFVPMLSAPTPSADKTAAPMKSSSDPSLEEQGIVYSPRKAVSVYSEFTSSFDSAVSSMPDQHSTVESDHWTDEHHESIEVSDSQPRSKTAFFLIWGIPLLCIVIAVTFYQQKASVTPEDTSPSKSKQDKSTTITPAPAVPQTAPVLAPQENAKAAPAAPPAVVAPVAQKNVIPRLSKLPDFVPTDERDKGYGKKNPGWERYRGRSMDFKVFREDSSITAIQVIDRSGKGIPESFLQSVQTSVANRSPFVLESSEKKDGYEIQRGRIADNLKTVYYRDSDGGKLRGFVITWQ